MNSSKNNTPENTIPAQVEQICQQGCTIVRQYIKALEASPESQQTNDSKQISDLLEETSELQQLEILKELKVIMAVYDKNNCEDS